MAGFTRSSPTSNVSRNACTSMTSTGGKSKVLRKPLKRRYVAALCKNVRSTVTVMSTEHIYSYSCLA